jgi:hypothetical protein
MADRKDQYDCHRTLVDVADKCEKTYHIEVEWLCRKRRNVAKAAFLALGKITATYSP